MSKTAKTFFKSKSVSNYFVRSESIKNGSRGLVGYVDYLKDKEHKNHKDRTSEIIHLGGKAENFLDTVVGEADKLQLQRDKAKKGGRPISSLAQSFVFAMPSSFVGKPTRKEYQAMAKDMLLVIADKLDLSLSDLKDHVYMNVHVNENNPHINILVGRTIKGQNYEKILTRPSTSNALKRESVRTVKRVLGLDIKDFKPVLPPGTTRGKRWDELNKMNKYKLKQGSKFFVRLAEINNKIKNIVKDVSEGLDILSSDFDERILEVKKDVKSFKTQEKEVLDEVKQNKDVKIEYKEVFESIEETNNNIHKMNEIKQKGRKIRGFSM